MRFVRRFFAAMLPLALFAGLLTGCASTPTEQRIDNFPMYGQPEIQRPDFLKKADEDFIKEASSGFGSREAASKAWATQADKFLSERNLDYAMRRYNQSWLLNPNNYRPYWGFGRVMLEQDKIDEAIGFLEKAKQLVDDPYQKVALLSDVGTAYSIKASSISKDQTTERDRHFALANQNFMESANLDPNYPHSWRRWAMSLHREGKYAESWDKVKKARALNAPPLPSAFLDDLQQKMPEPK